MNTPTVSALVPKRITKPGLLQLLKFSIFMAWAMGIMSVIGGAAIATQEVNGERPLAAYGLGLIAVAVALWSAIAAVLTYLRWNVEKAA